MKLYRYKLSYGDYDYGEYFLDLKEYEVYRETPRCYVIRYFGKDKFIRKDAKARFAYETKELALTNYIKRTNSWRNNFLEPQLRSAEIGLELAEKLREEI